MDIFRIERLLKQSQNAIKEEIQSRVQGSLVITRQEKIGNSDVKYVKKTNKLKEIYSKMEELLIAIDEYKF